MSTSELQALLALQDLDSRIDQERHRHAHLPQRAELEELARSAGEHAASRDAVAMTLAEVAARQEAAERELKATEDRARQVNARLYGGTVSASRELQAMASDVEGLRKRVSELEDRVLGLLDEREPLDASLAELDKILGELAARRAETESALAVAEAEVVAAIAGFEEQRPALATPVPDDLLAKYERLRTRLGGVAVARLVGGRCDGCHLSLPAVELDRIRHAAPGTMEHCDQCGRILVMPSPA